MESANWLIIRIFTIFCLWSSHWRGQYQEFRFKILIYVDTSSVVSLFNSIFTCLYILYLYFFSWTLSTFTKLGLQVCAFSHVCRTVCFCLASSFGGRNLTYLCLHFYHVSKLLGLLGSRLVLSKQLDSFQRFSLLEIPNLPLPQTYNQLIPDNSS